MTENSRDPLRDFPVLSGPDLPFYRASRPAPGAAEREPQRERMRAH
jgi:hypothetical protein